MNDRSTSNRSHMNHLANQSPLNQSQVNQRNINQLDIRTHRVNELKTANWLKLFFIGLLFLSACTKQEPIEEPKVTQPVEEVKKTPFELANIVTIEFREVSQPVESTHKLYEVVSTNHGDEEIVLEDFSYQSQDGREGSYVGKSIEAGQSITALFQSTIDLEEKQATHYGYHVERDQNYETRYYLNLTANEVSQQTYLKRSFDRKYILPLVPNNGVTLFAWKQNNEWVFDYARGIEFTDWKPLNVEQLSLINTLRYLDEDNLTYFYIQTADKKLSQTERNYIKQQFDFLLQYEDYEYVLEGKEYRFEELNQKYPYMETIQLIDQGDYNCKLTYCAYRVGAVFNDYQFDKTTKEQIGNHIFTIKELETELKQYKDNYYNMYVKGKDKQLTEEEAIELDKLFRDEEYWTQVENMKYVGADKPVIYLYPEEETDVHVQLEYRGEFTTTYPAYQSRNNDGWRVIAKPDGSLLNKADNREYSYLFWEGTGQVHYPMFCGEEGRRCSIPAG